MEELREDFKYATKSACFREVGMKLCKVALDKLKAKDKIKPLTNREMNIFTPVKATFLEETLMTTLPLPTEDDKLYYYDNPTIRKICMVTRENGNLTMHWFKDEKIVQCCDVNVIKQYLADMVCELMPHFEKKRLFCLTYTKMSNNIKKLSQICEQRDQILADRREALRRAIACRDTTKKIDCGKNISKLEAQIELIKECDKRIAADEKKVKTAETKRGIADINLKIALKERDNYSKQFSDYRAEVCNFASLQNYIIIRSCSMS